MSLMTAIRNFSLMTTIILFLSIITFSDEISPPNKDIYVPDIGTFMKIGHCSSPAINNNTAEIFFMSEMSGTDQLYRLTEEGWPYQLTLFDDGIISYELSKDGKKAIIRAARKGDENAQLYLTDTKSGRLEQLTSNFEVRHGSIAWKLDGSGFYYRANAENPRDFYLYYYDLVKGVQTRILELEGNNFIEAISPDQKYLVINHSYSNVSMDLYLMDLETGEYRMITPGKEDIKYLYPHIMPDNKTIYLTCNDNEQNILKLAVLNAETKAITYLDLKSEWIADELALSPGKRYMVWLTNEDGYSKAYIKDLESGRMLPSPPMTGIIDDINLTDDGRLLFRFTGSTSAPDIWLWDWKKPELRKITHSIYAGIDNSIFIEPELIKYKSFDGLEIPAILYLPPDFKGQPVPFIIHAHGGPESQFRPYLQRHFQYLLLNGYGILAPNVRGSDGYGREYLNLDNYKNRLSSIKDYKAGVDYLIENNYTKKGMIGIKGTSYGGYVVLASITEYPDLYSAAVDEVGIANFVTFLENTGSYRQHIREAEYGPLSDKEFLKSISPIHKADKIKTPLLVVHGVNDPRVPIGEARQIISAIQANGGVVDSLIFADEGHGTAKLANRLTFYRKMVEFFDRYLKNK